MNNQKSKILSSTFLQHALILMIFVFIIGCNFNQSEVSYNSQVKPILNKHCISCHGGVKQSSGFSLMTRETALLTNESGLPAIRPGNANDSELIRRLHHTDPDERMPQESDPLSDKEIDILTRWIDQGAEWGLHWSYQPITGENNPSTNVSANTSSDQVDQFVVQQLKKIGLSPNPLAKKAELLRRVSMDLIGVPAPISLQQKFLDEKINYNTLVDSLLLMEAFGEKWASMWLDIARYADSKGFERDQNRSIWAYRDYVIKTFNDDKPYDQFIIEQLAGDLLENASEEQYIATGFHRNTTTNDEGGTDNEEYRVKAVMDRVGTTWEGLMGTTMACVQCHGHPYDPFPHQEYYQSMAFLNNTRDADTHPDYPQLQLFDTQSRSTLDSLKEWIAEVASPEKAEEIELFVKTGQPVIYSLETDEMVNADLYDTKYLGLRKKGSARIPGVNLNGKTTLLMRSMTSVNGGRLSIHLDTPEGILLSNITLGNTKRKFELMELPLSYANGIHDLYLVYSNPALVDPDKPGIQFDWFYFTEDFPGRKDEGYAVNKGRFIKLLSTKSDHTLILTENPPDWRRTTYVLDRGNWLTHKEEVTPDVPDILPQISNSKNKDRLDFANWIASKENPLTARTFVNRVWEQLFGLGIVTTTEDLGSQGELPSHPELLDYLSYNWMHDQNWSMKSLIKTIVLSGSYQQSSRISKESLMKDPYNKYISRGPRVRLSAEQIRDQALFVSGVLSTKMYGPPVMPFQPEGIWKTPYNNQSWVTSEAEDQYRRAVYTMVKRSSIYPSMETFDMSQRQVCESRRIRTNTPLQALVTLNDPVYVEAAQNLAKKMMENGGEALIEQIDYAYKLAMSRSIPKEKGKIFEQLYYQTVETLKSDSTNVEADIELLALSNVANSIMNLDEFLNN